MFISDFLFLVFVYFSMFFIESAIEKLFLFLVNAIKLTTNEPITISVEISGYLKIK